MPPVIITRTPIHDDDHTGTTGTSIDNAWKQEFYDQIDGALGKLTPLVATSGQIPFPAAQKPSTDPNTLDDYEEGTWTPSLLFGGAGVGITYSEQKGFYVKIGGWIWLGIRIVLTNKGSSTGACTIGGLPFVDKDVASLGGTCNFYLGMAASVTSFPTFTAAGASLNVNMAGPGTYVGLDQSHFTNGSILIGSVAYRAN